MKQQPFVCLPNENSLLFKEKKKKLGNFEIINWEMSTIKRRAAECLVLSMIRIRRVANSVGYFSWIKSLHRSPIRIFRNRWCTALQHTEISAVSCDLLNRCCSCRYSHRWPTYTWPNSLNIDWKIELPARTIVAWCRPVWLDRIAIASLWCAPNDCTNRRADIVCFAANWHAESQSTAQDFDRLSPNTQRCIQNRKANNN